MLPSNMLILVEEAWNCYPFCKTVLTNGYLDKDKFKIVIESMHLPDNGSTDNALRLTAAELKERSIETLDISQAYADKAAKDYKRNYDSSLFHSTTTGRGPLAKGWERAHAPVMCCYKLCRAQFKYFGAQSKVESTIIKSQRDLFAKSLSSAFCMIEEWTGLTMADIRRLEDVAAAELNASVLAASPKPGPGAAAVSHETDHEHGHTAVPAAGAGSGHATAAAAVPAHTAPGPEEDVKAEPALST